MGGTLPPVEPCLRLPLVSESVPRCEEQTWLAPQPPLWLTPSSLSVQGASSSPAISCPDLSLPSRFGEDGGLGHKGSPTWCVAGDSSLCESVKLRCEFHETVRRAFPGVKSRMMFTTQYAFSGKAKDVLPATDQSLLVYEYTCCCGCTYVGKTIQHFSERIRQHVPEKLLADEPVLESARSDSAVKRHLKRSPGCISDETRGRFKVLARARSEAAHLNVLEALFIFKFTPTLCCQKDFVHVLKLFSK